MSKPTPVTPHIGRVIVPDGPTGPGVIHTWPTEPIRSSGRITRAEADRAREDAARANRRNGGKVMVVG